MKHDQPRSRRMSREATKYTRHGGEPAEPNEGFGEYEQLDDEWEEGFDEEDFEEEDFQEEDFEEEDFEEEDCEEEDCVITQEELTEYVALKEGAYRFREVHDGIVTKLEAGGVVEPGPLTAELSIGQTKCWSKQRIAEVVGDANARELWKRLGKTPCRRLLIRNRPGREDDRRANSNKA